MTNRIQPSTLVAAMLEQSSAARSTADLPVPGTYAGRYGEAVKGDLNGDNLQAFIDGTVMVNLLAQEVIVRVFQAAVDTLNDPEVKDDPNVAIYCEGIKDALTGVTALMSMTADQMVRDHIEGPLIDQAFSDLIKDF